MLTGFRTLLVGLGMAVLPALAQYLGAVDWSTVFPGSAGFIVGTLVSGAITILMRLITTSPVATPPAS